MLRELGISILGVCVAAGSPARAGIPEPDAIVYGELRLNGLLVTRQQANISVVARVDADRSPPGPSPNDTAGQLVGQYQMGDNQGAGDRYLLKVRLESLADGSPQSQDAALVGQTVRVFARVDNGPDLPLQPHEFVVSERGLIVERNLTDSSPPVASVLSTFPLQATPRLWRTTKHVIRLKFDTDITAPAFGEVELQELIAGGTFGPNLATAGNFTFAIENDENVRPRVLKIEDTGNNLVLDSTNPDIARKWYRVMNTAWVGVQPFDIDFVLCPGDANNDNRVNSNDLAFVNSRIAPQSGVPFSWTDLTLQKRYQSNVNADNFVNANDLSAINTRIGPLACPAKPTGH